MSTFPSLDYVSIKTNGVNLFEVILAFLSGKISSAPALYGWYHILCLITVIGLCVFVFFRARSISDKQMDLLLGCTAAGLMLLEVYKQLVFSYDSSSDAWSYQWYAFPLQFCSTPMYAMLLSAIIPNKKIKEHIYAFLATYGLFGGIVVMFYPGDVFMDIIGINIHTMIHHGGMVVIGFLMYVSGRAKFSHNTILKALPVFCIFVGIALTANFLYHFFGDPTQTFNMFYISPYYPCTLPVLNMFYGKVPYVVFLLIYVGGFTLAGYLLSLIAMGVNKVRVLMENKLQPNTPPIDQDDGLFI